MGRKWDSNTSLTDMKKDGLYGRKPSNTGIRGITWQESRMKFQCSIYMDKGERIQKYFPTGLKSSGPRYEEAFRKAQEWMLAMEKKKEAGDYEKSNVSNMSNHQVPNPLNEYPFSSDIKAPKITNQQENDHIISGNLDTAASAVAHILSHSPFGIN